MSADLELQLHSGTTALAVLRVPGFMAEWDDLHAQCAWSTPYQARSFVAPWLAHYGELHPPVLVTARAHGALAGMLLLVEHGGMLVGAGAHQAEYHAWLARDDAARTFPARAIEVVSSRLPEAAIRFKYLAPGLDPAPLCADASLRGRVQTFAHRRPLLRLDAERIAESFKKKGNKSRINRLDKLGGLRFERVTDAAELARELPQIASHYDLRQGATNGVLPFASDPRKAPFHVDWLRAAGAAMHVTVLRVGGAVCAAHVGAAGRSEVHLAILAHSPLLARHSPGKIHVMMLSRALLEEGVRALDLTPGGDEWKERFATDHDDVVEVLIHPTPGDRRRALVRAALRARGKRVATALGLPPARLRALRDSVRIDRLPHTVRALFPRLTELRIYRRDTEALVGEPADQELRRDDLELVLRYAPAPGEPTQRAFLSNALERFEGGARCYAFARDGRLAHCGWATIGDAAQFPEVAQALTLPEGSALLHDFWTEPVSRRRGLCGRALRAALGDLHASGVRHAFAAVPAGAAVARRIVEKAGFVWQGSLFAAHGRGRTRMWQAGLDGEGMAVTALTQTPDGERGE